MSHVISLDFVKKSVNDVLVRLSLWIFKLCTANSFVSQVVHKGVDLSAVVDDLKLAFDNVFLQGPKFISHVLLQVTSNFVRFWVVFVDNLFIVFALSFSF